jgi:hypothetical protein
VAATIGTWDIEHFPAGIEQSFVVRNRSNTYNMVGNDVVSVEFPSNATNGLEVSTNSVDTNPIQNCTTRTHNGTSWNATASDPAAIVVKG